METLVDRGVIAYLKPLIGGRRSIVRRTERPSHWMTEIVDMMSEGCRPLPYKKPTLPERVSERLHNLIPKGADFWEKAFKI